MRQGQNVETKEALRLFYFSALSLSHLIHFAFANEFISVRFQIRCVCSICTTWVRTRILYAPNSHLATTSATTKTHIIRIILVWRFVSAWKIKKRCLCARVSVVRVYLLVNLYIFTFNLHYLSTSMRLNTTPDIRISFFRCNLRIRFSSTSPSSSSCYAMTRYA